MCQNSRTLNIEVIKKAQTSKIVTWKRLFSKPLRVRNDDSADPNKPDP
jgi:hypothetical protein